MADTDVKIGPTFGAELIAAGLGGLPFSWGSDGSFEPADLSSLSAAQKAGVLAVYAAHNPVASLTAAAFAALRARRDALLAACDWTQLGDVPDNITKTAWAAYRQALRDLPDNTTDPADPAWPTVPT
jgi:hypothetical protein